MKKLRVIPPTRQNRNHIVLKVSGPVLSKALPTTDMAPVWVKAMRAPPSTIPCSNISHGTLFSRLSLRWALWLRMYRTCTASRHARNGAEQPLSERPSSRARVDFLSLSLFLYLSYPITASCSNNNAQRMQSNQTRSCPHRLSLLHIPFSLYFPSRALGQRLLTPNR